MDHWINTVAADLIYALDDARKGRFFYAGQWHSSALRSVSYIEDESVKARAMLLLETVANEARRLELASRRAA